jgi:hypothetical protein
MTNEYEDNESDLDKNGDESHTFVTQFDPRNHTEAPIVEGVAEHVQNELNRVEKHLDLTKTAQTRHEDTLDTLDSHEDFAETAKEQQARKLLEMQFAQTQAKPTIRAQNQQKLEKIMDSSPLAKIAQLKEENRQRQLQHHLDMVESKLTPQRQLPMPLETPPPKPSQKFQTLGQTLEINRTTTAMQWAINAQKAATREATELPPQYHQHWQVFSEKLAQRFPPARKDDHAIKLCPGALDTIPSRAYKWTPEEDKVGREWLRENEDLGYIKKGDSLWATPCFFVKKKDGKLRPVQDYHVVNEWTIPDVYPLPQIETILEQLEGKALFTTLDICWGYNNIHIKQDDQWKAAFITPYGLYIPKVMPFGL